jgi:hypothetical protein
MAQQPVAAAVSAAAPSAVVQATVLSASHTASPAATATTSASISTPAPVAAPVQNSAVESPLPTPVPVEIATPTSTPLPVPQPVVAPSGWSLAGVRTCADENEEGLLVYGDLINDTGVSQALALITGTFYDEQGQIIANNENTYDYWPFVDAIPPGGSVPFVLTVDGIRSAATFSLDVEAEPSSESPHQDIEFLDSSQRDEGGAYCVAGQLRSPATGLQNYLVIMAVLYDEQGNVVNFGDYYEPYLENNQSLNFEICVAPPYQDVARYELRAWGL